MRRKQAMWMLFLGVAGVLRAGDAPPVLPITLSGVVPRSGLIITSLAGYSRVRAQITRRNSDRPDTIEGVPLMHLLQRAGIWPDDTSQSAAMAYLVITGRDGASAVLSLGELQAEGSERSYLIADRINGQALAAKDGPFQLIVAGDRENARSIHQVNRIVVRRADPPLQHVPARPRTMARVPVIAPHTP